MDTSSNPTEVVATAAAYLYNPIAAPEKTAAVQPPSNGTQPEVVATGNGTHTNGTAAVEPDVAPAQNGSPAETVNDLVAPTEAISLNESAPTEAVSIAEPALIEAISAPAPIEAISAPAPIEAISAPAPIEAISTDASAPIEAISAQAPAPIEAIHIAEPAPIAGIVSAASDVSAAAPEPVTRPTGVQSLPAFVRQALDDIAVRESFGPYETKVDHGTNSGDGFVGDIVRVTIAGVQTLHGVAHADAELSLIVKLPPVNAVRRELVAMQLFEREVLVYTELLPAFERFQAEHGLRPGLDGFHSYPKCYYAHFDRAADQAAIILENLLARGFAMESKFESISFEYARSVLEKLAELHGISLAWKAQRPAEFERFTKLGDVFDYESEQSKAMNRILINKGAESALAALGDGEQALRDKVRRAADVIPDEFERYRGVHAEPYSVVIHGDCWVNNIMFRHESGQSRQVSFFDWQCTRYGSPVLDIVYFLFLCTDAPLRARYYDDLIQAYHHALRAQLDRLDADVNELFPLTAMLRQLKQSGKYALGASLMIVQMLVTEKTDLPDMDDIMQKLKDGAVQDGFFQVNERAQKKYEERISGILRDLNKKGYLN